MLKSACYVTLDYHEGIPYIHVTSYMRQNFAFQAQLANLLTISSRLLGSHWACEFDLL